MNLSIREWTYPAYGEHHDRDVNAAKNILCKRLNQMSGCGMQSDFKHELKEALAMLAESMSSETTLSLITR
jgi:hypothetical protein